MKIQLLILSAMILVAQTSKVRAQADSPATRPSPTTYCNPLPLPDYPVGKNVRDIEVGAPVGNQNLWLQDTQEQFRELADVSVLWYDGKWYMYPSVDMAWVSADGGASWQHHPINTRDLGYAPTIVRHKGKFLLMGSKSPVYTADSPLGPFTLLGRIPTPRNFPAQVDPMLYSDDDGRLFFYWGCTAADGIYGVELDPDDLTRLRGEPQRLVKFEPSTNPWQRFGEWNENHHAGWLEGAWMIKRNGTYYLTYCAAGTENRTYAVGCVTSKLPLGPFAPQKHNPILRSTEGLITGTGHGSFVEGPNKSLWAFYTLRAGVVHGWERRLGMDPAYIGDDGELHVRGPSSTPQRLATAESPATPTGWLPLNANHRTSATSTAPNLQGRMAVDDDLRTWWQPAANDTAPALTTYLSRISTVCAIRLVWRDIGIDTRKNVRPGPFRYRVEAQMGDGSWKIILDRSQSTDDFLIDYRECTPTDAKAVRVVIVGTPPGITPAVAEFTAFGNVTGK